MLRFYLRVWQAMDMPQASRPLLLSSTSYLALWLGRTRHHGIIFWSGTHPDRVSESQTSLCTACVCDGAMMCRLSRLSVSIALITHSSLHKFLSQPTCAGCTGRAVRGTTIECVLRSLPGHTMTVSLTLDYRFLLCYPQHRQQAHVLNIAAPSLAAVVVRGSALALDLCTLQHLASRGE